MGAAACSSAGTEDGTLDDGGVGTGGAFYGSGGSFATGGAVALTGGASSGGAVGSGGLATGGAATGGAATGGSEATGGSSGGECTNVRPTGTDWDAATCDMWANQTSECSAAWMIDNNYCNESCGRCSASATGGAAGTGGAASTGGAAGTGGAASTGGSSGTGGSGSIDCSGASLTGGTQKCSSTQGTMANGVAYSVWLSDSTTGTNCGTFFNVGAAFKASWNMGSGGDFLARAGLEWNKTKTYDQLGTISADYAYKKTGVSNTTAFIGIYGWSSSPLVEFYIVEEWIGWNPASNATKKGSITIDGEGTYDIYTHTQNNQPSIEGNATFPQFFSIRTSTRECGHISISKHFKAWADAGMTLGKMFEAKLLVEAMGGTGVIDFTTAKVEAK